MHLYLYILTKGLESTTRLRKIEDDLLNLVGTSSSRNSSGKSINTVSLTAVNFSNDSTLLSTLNIPYKKQLVILCSANCDAATVKLAYDAGVY